MLEECHPGNSFEGRHVGKPRLENELDLTAFTAPPVKSRRYEVPTESLQLYSDLELRKSRNKTSISQKTRGSQEPERKRAVGLNAEVKVRDTG